MRGPCRGPEIEELDNQLRVVSAPEKSPKRRKQPPKNVSKERIGAWHQFASPNPTHPPPIPFTPNKHQTQKVGGTNLKRCTKGGWHQLRKMLAKKEMSG